MSVMKLFLTGIMGFLLLLILLLISLVFLLDRTLLNRDFAMAELERSDAVGMAKEMVLKHLPENARPYAPAITSSMEELRPWFLQQSRGAINAGYDFLLGKTERFELTIQTEPLRQSLVTHLTQSVRDNLPPEYHNLSPADQARAFADIEREIKAQLRINPVYHVGIDSLPADARVALLRARKAVGYLRVTYNIAIAVAVALALGMVLLRRSFLGVGIVLLLVCAVDFGVWNLARSISSSIPPDPSVPAEIRAYLPQLVGRLMEPLQQFGICAGVAGLLLVLLAITVYIIRKPDAVQPAA
jgi:hypothetical protein